MSYSSGTPDKKADTRTVILNTALRLFTQNGYFNTSVHDIKREAHLSIGSIYHYFKGKDEIAKALYHDLLEEMEQQFNLIASSHSSTHDRCKAVVSLLLSMTDEKPEAMAFMLHAKHREFLPNETPVCSSKPFTLMKGMVREGIEKGEIRELDPLVAAAVMFGGPIRLIHLHLDGIFAGPLVRQLPSIWDCAWKSVSA
ncbi:MAG: TetR family transcriptional regulator [Desulfuromonas sp.]|nr:MAG: TetR family transcriptional regulator [Desulfuromonas sp.]